jgi:hypothetical protein
MSKTLNQKPAIRVLIDLSLEESDKLIELAETQYMSRKRLIERMIRDGLNLQFKAVENYQKTFIQED